MCGIAGMLRFDDAPASAALVRAMADRLSHRGPDDHDVYTSGPAGLGHRRLAVIDLSVSGRQPMSNEDQSIWITYNGELYNYLALRAELAQRGHRFRSSTDTEVVLHAYEEWGVDCVSRFNGMFAFGLWDERRQRLWLVRDRLGIKPLFYAQHGNRLLFGSEIKALTADKTLPRTLDYQALAYYLSLNYTPAPWTLLAHVRQLLPGQYLLAGTNGQLQLETYWQLNFVERDPQPAQWYVDRFAELLADAVRLRLASDVPFGAFLSGGLDSSSVAYWMTRALDRPVKTFTIGFGEPGFDERDSAALVARSLGADHHTRVISADTAAILPTLVWHAEEPTADSSMVAMYYLAGVAREHVTMVLAGDGADELLAGYETYQAFYLQRIFRRLPEQLRRYCIAPIVNALPARYGKVTTGEKLRRFVAAGDLPPEDAHALWRIIFDGGALRALLAPIWHDRRAHAGVVDLYRQQFRATNARRPLNRLLAVDTMFYLPNDMLVKVDRMTMAHGLEARVPFLDHRLVEFLATVPPELKLRWGLKRKYLLRRAMASRLPAATIQRRKAGFNVPNGRWMRGRLRDFVEENLSVDRVQNMGILADRPVRQLLENHFKDKMDNSHQIWCLLTLSLWWQLYQPAGD